VSFKKGYIPWNKGIFIPNEIVYQDSIITKILIKSQVYGDFKIILDTEDYEKIKNFHCNILKNPSNNKFYVTVYYNNKAKKLSRIIMNINNPKIQVDHKFGDTLDNRKENLRICDNSQNQANKLTNKNNVSGYKGVSWYEQLKKWVVHIGYNNKQIHLGYFKNKIDAAKAYNEAALKYHGEFAKLNIIG
jgi:hypothetical protein